jgi:hypothetical protein
MWQAGFFRRLRNTTARHPAEVGEFADPWRFPGPLRWANRSEWRFFAIGTVFEYFRPRPRRAAKGRKHMTIQSSVKRTFIAISAAIAMSTVAVGAAVGPAQAASAPSKATVHV